MYPAIQLITAFKPSAMTKRRPKILRLFGRPRGRVSCVDASSARPRACFCWLDLTQVVRELPEVSAISALPCSKTSMLEDIARSLTSLSGKGR
jgi:hypothetical protein